MRRMPNRPCRESPTQKELASFYDRAEWFEGGEAGGYSDYDAQTESSLAGIEEFLETFSGENLSILDVGCGYMETT